MLQLRTLIVLSLVFFSIPPQVNAQQCHSTFQIRMKMAKGAAGQAVVYTAQADIVVAGQVNTVTNQWDGLLLRTNELGELLWTRSFGRADDDRLLKVKQTADNGFVAAGVSMSGTLPRLWVLKTDAAGQLVWSKVIDVEGQALTGKDIIELSGGGYAVVANTNDSTAQADGILIRLDADGDLLWVQQYESGGADGFNSLLEINGELLVAGFISGDLKDAFLMRAAMDDGRTLSVLRYSRFAGYAEEGSSLNAIPGGYSWAMKIVERETPYDYYDKHVLMIRALADGTNYLVQSQEAYTHGGRGIRNLQVKPCSGPGFVYIMDGPWGVSNPQICKIGPEGFQEWNRSPKGNQYNVPEAFNGLDVAGNSGFVITGRTYDDDIFLARTDPSGLAGNCAVTSSGGDPGGGDKIEGDVYQWPVVRQPPATLSSPAFLTADQSVTSIVDCSLPYCQPAPPVDNGEDCATSFLAAVKEVFSTRLVDAVRTGDGDIVTIGSRTSSFTSLSQVIKLKPGGNVRWAKQFGAEQGGRISPIFTRVLNTSDNNILVVGLDRVNGAGLVMKMDYNGNVVRTLYFYHINIVFVEETEDEGLILAGTGGSTRTNYIIRTDKNGRFIWQKNLGQQLNQRIIRGLLYYRDGVYLAGDFERRNPNEITIVKLDAAAGDLIWARHYKSPGETVSVLGLAGIADTVYVGTGLLTDLGFENYRFHGAVLKLKDDTGEQLPGFRLNSPWMSTSKDYAFAVDQTAVTFTKSIDDQLIIAHESAQNKDTTIRVHKLALDGSVTWSRNFTALKKHAVNSVKGDGAGLLITGQKYGMNQTKERVDEGFLMRLNSNGEIENGSGDCVNQPVPVGAAGAYTTPLQLMEETLNMPAIDQANLKMDVGVKESLPSPVLSYPSCANNATCNRVTVKGPEKVCDLSLTYTYEAQVAPGCTLPLSWVVDQAAVEIVSRSNNKLIVKFRENAGTSVQAVLDAGCSAITATVNVEIAPAASIVSLGADTEICKDAVLKLDAEQGYASYLWSNGSTMQTIEVTAPGTYAVTVTDMCGNRASDEVVLADGGKHSFSLGPDILKCAEAVASVDLPAGFSDFSWNTDYNREVNGMQVRFFPETDTAYVLQGSRGAGCVFKDTLVVKIQTPGKIGFPADRSICSGDVLELSIPTGFSNIQWSTGYTGKTLTVKAAGEISVSATDHQGCIAKDTFNLQLLLPAPEVSLPRLPYICEGTNIILDAGNQGEDYLWSTGSVSQAISVNSPGKWWVKVTGANGCSIVDTAWIKEVALNPRNFVLSDTLMCQRGEINIPVKTRFAAYRWSNGHTGAVMTTRSSGNYWLEVTDSYGCSGREYFNIGIKECGWGVFVPTAFTPNGDGVNDFLRPVVMGKTLKYRFSVFDRWGGLVFHSAEINSGWDGKLKGNAVPAGTYVWACTYQLDGDTEKVITGTAVLIR